jgi:hypothetical protein
MSSEVFQAYEDLREALKVALSAIETIKADSSN